MNLKTLLITASLALSVGVTSATVPAQAASWHNGAPKAIQGKWGWDKHDPNAASGSWANMTVKNNKSMYDSQGNHAICSLIYKYKSLGHGKYLLHESSYAGANIWHQNEKITVLDHNKKLKFDYKGPGSVLSKLSKSSKGAPDIKYWSMSN